MAVQDAHKSHAANYDKLCEPTAAKLREIGLRLFPPRDNLSILDVGCGTGTQLALYRRAGCSLHGIDTSEAMLAVDRVLLSCTKVHTGPASGSGAGNRLIHGSRSGGRDYLFSVLRFS
jgi:ubiquinone/menaquinone biosynthesis C-methylase UbiE